MCPICSYLTTSTVQLGLHVWTATNSIDALVPPSEPNVYSSRTNVNPCITYMTQQKSRWILSAHSNTRFHQQSHQRDDKKQSLPSTLVEILSKSEQYTIITVAILLILPGTMTQPASVTNRELRWNVLSVSKITAALLHAQTLFLQTSSSSDYHHHCSLLLTWCI